MDCKPVTLLAIDDSQENLLVITELLREICPAVTVLTANHGAEGIVLARKHDPHVILLDIVMPEMDGFRVCEKLKEDQLLRDIPVVFMTGLTADNQNRIRALDAGAEGFLAKPFDEAELVAQIRAMVKIKAANMMKRNEHQRLNIFLDSIIENIPNMLFIKDAQDLRFVRFNKAGEELLGYSRNDLLGKNDYDFFPDKQADFFTQKDREVLQGKIVVDIPEENIQTKYKGDRVLHTRKVPIINDEGHPEYLLGFSEDITDRKKAEVALQASEERFAQTIAAVNDGLWDWDVPSGNAYFSKLYYALLGYDDQEFPATYNAWRCLVHPDDIERVEAELQQNIARGEGFAIDLRMKMKSGQWLWVSTRGKTIKLDARGKAQRMVGTLSDITARKQAELNLQISEAKFRTMFQQAPLGIALIDSVTERICEVNPKFSEITGRTPNELTTIDWMSITHPDNVPAVLENMTLLRAGKIPAYTMESRIMRPDGFIVSINMTITPMNIDDTHSSCDLCMIQDVTDIHIMEARMRQSEKMEAIGQLAGGIAHDFNNVLGGIIGYTDMSLDFAEKGSVLENNLRKVLKASDRAKHLIRQILTFSRQDNQQKSVIAIRPIVKEVLELLKASIPSSVIIEVDLQKDVKPVLANPTQIHEALLNLATNAVHAMERKGTLTVRLYSSLVEEDIFGHSGKIEPGRYAVIEIIDTGCGMDNETIQKAFVPFFTTKPVGQGTGMGLSVVLGVVQSHGGDVQVETQSGQGTTFRIFLPVTDDFESSEPGSDNAICRKGAGRILFVDDEKALVEMAVEMLGALGYTVTGMSESIAALEYITRKSSEIDILVTDQTMPLMTGMELAAAAHKINKALPIILCTGYSAEINQRQAAEIGIYKLLLKPLRRLDFAKTLCEVLGN